MKCVEVPEDFNFPKIGLTFLRGCRELSTELLYENKNDVEYVMVQRHVPLLEKVREDFPRWTGVGPRNEHRMRISRTSTKKAPVGAFCVSISMKTAPVRSVNQ